MKKINFTILLLLFWSSVFGQNIFEYSIVDSLDKSQEELYLKARSFLAYAFKDSKSVIQMDDKEIGRIIGKGNITLNTKTGMSKYSNVINFTITIDLRDNKYRCVINDVYHDGLRNQEGFIGGYLTNEKPDCGYIWLTKNAWNDIKINIPDKFKEFLDQFKGYMESEQNLDDF